MPATENSGGAGDQLAIELRNVGKCYVLRKQRPFLLREIVRRIVQRKARHEKFWAIRDLSFEIRHGESVGIIGTNGAGKSTLLGLIAGAVFPTVGAVRVHGRIGALLELGAGFHADLTGRENVYLNASLLGLSRAQVEDRFKSIVAFSELGEFIDVQLRNYSSGMHVRLGFSVAVHIDPEILLIDEALSVGDQGFQHKCVDRIKQFRAEGKALLFVSHSPALVRILCDRAIWLERGALRMDGPAEEVLAAYARATG